METLKYRIDSCLEQTIRIKTEYPNVSRVDFELNDCKFSELDEYAKSVGREVVIEDCRGTLTRSSHLHDTNAVIFFKTKQLIVSQNVQEVEE